MWIRALLCVIWFVVHNSTGSVQAHADSEIGSLYGLCQMGQAQKSILYMGWSRTFWLLWREDFSRRQGEELGEPWGYYWHRALLRYSLSHQPSPYSSPPSLLLSAVSLIPGIFLVEKRQENFALSLKFFFYLLSTLSFFPLHEPTSKKRFSFSLLSPITFLPQRQWIQND